MRDLKTEVIAELDRLGCNYEFKPGKKHQKIFINNKLAGILPYGKDSERGTALKKTLAQLRRAAA